jgi:hypothetical protein
MKIRYRWSAPPDARRPMHGDYLMSARGRGGYLILGIDDRGPRGGLGQPVYELLVLTVERVPRAECLANEDRLFGIQWDSRKRRAPHRFNNYARLGGAL